MSVIWIDGALVEAESARVSPLDRGFTLGDGAFETLAIAAGRPRRWRAHLTRLCATCRALGFDIQPRLAELARAITLAARANQITEGVARVTVSRGEGPRGLAPPDPTRPVPIITLSPAAPPRPPARLGETRIRRGMTAFTARHKTLSYLENVAALADAGARWPGIDEALVLADDETVCGGAAANLFVIKGDEVLTPPLSVPILPGVTRAAVLALCRAGEVTAREIELSRADVLGAEAAFLTNALVGVRAIESVQTQDGQCGLHTDHPLLMRLAEAERRASG